MNTYFLIEEVCKFLEVGSRGYYKIEKHNYLVVDNVLDRGFAVAHPSTIFCLFGKIIGLNEDSLSLGT